MEDRVDIEQINESKVQSAENALPGDAGLSPHIVNLRHSGCLPNLSELESCGILKSETSEEESGYDSFEELFDACADPFDECGISWHRAETLDECNLAELLEPTSTLNLEETIRQTAFLTQGEEEEKVSSETLVIDGSLTAVSQSVSLSLENLRSSSPFVPFTSDNFGCVSDIFGLDLDDAVFCGSSSQTRARRDGVSSISLPDIEDVWSPVMPPSCEFMPDELLIDPFNRLHGEMREVDGLGLSGLMEMNSLDGFLGDGARVLRDDAAFEEESRNKELFDRMNTEEAFNLFRSTFGDRLDEHLFAGEFIEYDPTDSISSSSPVDSMSSSPVDSISSSPVDSMSSSPTDSKSSSLTDSMSCNSLSSNRETDRSLEEVLDVSSDEEELPEVHDVSSDEEVDVLVVDHRQWILTDDVEDDEIDLVESVPSRVCSPSNNYDDVEEPSDVPGWTTFLDHPYASLHTSRDHLNQKPRAQKPRGRPRKRLRVTVRQRVCDEQRERKRRNVDVDDKRQELNEKERGRRNNVKVLMAELRSKLPDGSKKKLGNLKILQQSQVYIESLEYEFEQLEEEKRRCLNLSKKLLQKKLFWEQQRCAWSSCRNRKIVA